MAERSARKPKRRAEQGLARSALAVGSGESAGGALRDRLAAAESECARLRAALAAAESRVRSLEERHAQVVNRIDWMIDSLHNVLGE